MAETSFGVREAGKERAIVLIHGFGGEAQQTFGMLPAFLAGAPALYEWDIHCFGYPTSLAPDITGVWAADPDLTGLAGLLSTYLENGRYAAYREIALVAHSMGGLVVQRALLDGGFLGRVRHVVLFGTPSNGLRKARLARIFKRQARDMAWGGPFITSLRAEWDKRLANPPFGFAAVAGVRDEFVPEASSVTPFPARFRKRVNGNHLQMVKPATAAGDAAVLLLNLLAGAPAAGAPEIRTHSARYTADVERLGGRDALSEPELGRLALALEMTGRQGDAIALLEPRHGESPELTGMLAGRYKRIFLADPDAAEVEGERALALYRGAFEAAEAQGDDPQAYYNGINVAFMELALNDDGAGAATVAARVMEHCERARRAGKQDRWTLATEAESALYLGRHEQAVELYRSALNEVVEERERASMLRQGIWASRLLEAPAAETELSALHDPARADAPIAGGPHG